MNIPQGFIDEIKSYESPHFDGLIEALSETDPSVSVRANSGKGIVVPDGADLVPWCKEGWYLVRRQPFTFDPAMHQGLYYVQDASSMIISHIVKTLVSEFEEDASLRYLDACAAPGGKTTAAVDALPSTALVVANEYASARAVVLRENIIKWGTPNVVVTRGDASKYGKLKAFFDIIAADVPCSGEGMMRKDSDAVAQWSHSLVEECAMRQREIVDSLWMALKPGGYLIYSTCTFNRSENEEIIDYICRNYQAESVRIPYCDEWGIVEGINTKAHCCRFLPHRVKGEGLFVAVLKKTKSDDCEQPRKPSAKIKKQGKNKQEQQFKEVEQWLQSPEKYDLRIIGSDQISVFPKHYASELALLQSTLDVIYSGVTIASIKGKDIIPAQSLAMATLLNKKSFHNHEVDYATAIAYLRRESVVIESAPRGYVLLTYKNEPLGFVKNLGNRANNLYPQEWKILSSHMPENPPQIIP